MDDFEMGSILVVVGERCLEKFVMERNRRHGLNIVWPKYLCIDATAFTG